MSLNAEQIEHKIILHLLQTATGPQFHFFSKTNLPMCFGVRIDHISTLDFFQIFKMIFRGPPAPQKGMYIGTHAKMTSGGLTREQIDIEKN